MASNNVKLHDGQFHKDVKPNPHSKVLQADHRPLSDLVGRQRASLRWSRSMLFDTLRTTGRASIGTYCEPAIDA